jgi:hypothetical protein
MDADGSSSTGHRQAWAEARMNRTGPVEEYELEERATQRGSAKARGGRGGSSGRGAGLGAGGTRGAAGLGGRAGFCGMLACRVTVRRLPSLSRCAFPITEFRVNPSPSSAAIVEAEAPFAHSTRNMDSAAAVQLLST